MFSDVTPAYFTLLTGYSGNLEIFRGTNVGGKKIIFVAVDAFGKYPYYSYPYQ